MVTYCPVGNKCMAKALPVGIGDNKLPLRLSTVLRDKGGPSHLLSVFMHEPLTVTTVSDALKLPALVYCKQAVALQLLN